MANGEFTVFAGSANRPLAEDIARELGIQLGRCAIQRFPDGEVSIHLDEPVRGHDVYIIQPTSPPVDEHLIELLAFADACRRASTARITVVVPYFGYARSDKRAGRREPIAASMVATLFQAIGIDHVITLDLHTPQIEGFFRIPMDSLTAIPVICAELGTWLPSDTVVIAPDAGRVSMATAYAQRLDLPLVVLHKRRLSGESTAVTHIVGDPVGQHCLIVDDMVSTGSTILQSVTTLREHGAHPEFFVAATHGLLLDNACQNLVEEGVTQIVVTDTVDSTVPPACAVHRVSVAPLIASAIRQIIVDGSLSALYESEQLG